jgi:hypothetical protein
MDFFMDQDIEQELRRLAAEQGRDLDEVVETALRQYIVSETFADDGSADVHTAPAPFAADDSVLADDSIFATGDLLDDVAAFGDSVLGDSVLGGAVLGGGAMPGDDPFPTDESVSEGSLEIAGLGDRPPTADSDTVIIGSIDWSDD